MGEGLFGEAGDLFLSGGLLGKERIYRFRCIFLIVGFLIEIFVYVVLRVVLVAAANLA